MCIVLHCKVLHCIVGTVLHCKVLHCIVCIVLHCIVGMVGFMPQQTDLIYTGFLCKLKDLLMTMIAEKIKLLVSKNEKTVPVDIIIMHN